MKPARLNDCLAIIGWPIREVARRLEMPESGIRWWLAGRYPVPDEIAQWLEELANAIETIPPPERPDKARPARKPKVAA